MVLVLTALLAFYLPAAAIGESPNTRAPFERRAHSGLESHDRLRLYDVTVVTRTTESDDQTLWLVQDVLNGDRFILTKTLDFTSQELRYQIAFLGSKSAITAFFLLPFHARTRSDTLKAFHEMTPETFSKVDTEWTVDSGGFKITAHESEWKNNSLRGREWTSELRRVASPLLLEAIERMSGTLFATVELRGFAEAIAGHMLHRVNCSETIGVSVVRLEPDCDFDAAFGYDCSTQQKRLIQTARSENKPVTTY